MNSDKAINSGTPLASTSGHYAPRFTLHVLRLWVPVLLWAGLIFWFSSIPYLRLVQPWWDIILRKLGHALVFGVLARLVARAWTGSTRWSWKRIFVWSLVLTFLYACSDEIHQAFVPGRSCTLGDVLIDTTGGWLSLGVIP
jgi:VanZ family protein